RRPQTRRPPTTASRPRVAAPAPARSAPASLSPIRSVAPLAPSPKIVSGNSSTADKTATPACSAPARRQPLAGRQRGGGHADLADVAEETVGARAIPRAAAHHPWRRGRQCRQADDIAAVAQHRRAFHVHHRVVRGRIVDDGDVHPVAGDDLARPAGHAVALAADGRHHFPLHFAQAGDGEQQRRRLRIAAVEAGQVAALAVARHDVHPRVLGLVPRRVDLDEGFDRVAGGGEGLGVDGRAGIGQEVAEARRVLVGVEEADRARRRRQAVVVVAPDNIAVLRADNAALVELVARERVGAGDVLDLGAGRHRRAIGAAVEAPVRDGRCDFRIVVRILRQHRLDHGRLGVALQHQRLGLVNQRRGDGGLAGAE
ncbi:conserved hypothetical protein, partial [Ricinus communis]